MPTRPNELRQIEKSKNTYVSGLLVNCLYLQSINLKRPLSIGSRFKTYFRLERRGNRGSRQNFHKISFSKDLLINNAELRDISTRIICMTISIRLKII